jgi:transposase-like protein
VKPGLHGKLSPKQIEVIEALASGPSVSEAAKRAGIDRSTIYLWRKEDCHFEGQLTLAQREYADTMRARLRELVDGAVKTIREVLGGNRYSTGCSAQSSFVCGSIRCGKGRLGGRGGSTANVAELRAQSDP